MKRQLVAELNKLGIYVNNDGLVKVADIANALGKTHASISGDEGFKTEVEVEVLYAPEGVPEDAELLTTKIFLEWRIHIETRDWGVKSMSAYVPDQTIELEFEDEKTKKKYTAKVTLKDTEIEYPRDSLGGVLRGWGIRPRTLTIAEDYSALSFHNRG